MRKLLLLLPTTLCLALINACGETSSCKVNADCPDGKSCLGGQCYSTGKQEGDCENGATRSCGNVATGLCKQGTQRCVDGSWESTCTGEVKPATETCNGLDDDCDGQVDEGAEKTWYPDVDHDGHGDAASAGIKSCDAVTGYVESNDDCNDGAVSISPSATERCTGQVDDDCDGTINEGCGCSNPGASIPCCSGRGSQVCGDDSMLGACSVSATPETCNGLDDDCDGQVDEGASACSGGQACTNGACACPAGQLLCNGVCGVSSAETCDNLDNDCNGTVDDNAPAPVATDGGVVTFSGGALLPDGTCEVGVGECKRTGNGLCVAGGAGCSVTAGAASSERCNNLDDDCDGVVDNAATCSGGQSCVAGSCTCPSGESLCNGTCRVVTAEVCDGIDNDCDGEIDETLTIACYADADGDRYAESNTATRQCPMGSRTQYGFCPTGYVAPTAALGTSDCAPNSATAWRVVPSRTDIDADSFCAGPITEDCVGASALSGRRFTDSCNAQTDCDDMNPGLFMLTALRKDVDGDGYCAQGSENICIGSTPPSGYVFPSACNPANNDCADMDNKRWYEGTGRRDADGDGWCVFANTVICLGNGTNSGWRPSNQCLGTDCKDDNAAANAACLIIAGYTTSSRAQACPSGGPTNYSVLPQTFCAAGFSQQNPRVEKSGAGNCVYVNETTIQQWCNVFEGSTCRVVADCVAN